MKSRTILILSASFLVSEGVHAGNAVATLPTLEIEGRRIALTEPAGTFAAPVSRLTLEPLVDVQTRNLAEAQGDVTIRGGIFENTGFRLGAVTLFDPQTGHYFAEIPLAPEFLHSPRVLTGAANAHAGFNSTVGTVHYQFAPSVRRGSIRAGGGDKGLNYQRLIATEFLDIGGEDLRAHASFEVSRSEGNGTRPNGGHDFMRYSGRISLEHGLQRWDVFAGYQSKFFSWPNLYTPFPGFIETEQLKTRLFGTDWRTEYGEDSHLQVTGYFRRHSDDYKILQFSGALFTHETRVWALGWDGGHQFNEHFGILHAGQWTADRIRSNRLENSFTSRRYAKISVLPELRAAESADRAHAVRAGLAYDWSNRDSGAISPIIEFERTERRGDVDLRWHTGYAEATQVPGYTAIGGAMTGLFASNPDLGRERSRNIEAGVAAERGAWRGMVTVFHRWDNNLVDWTFSNKQLNERDATAVDLRTLGVETVIGRKYDRFEWLLGYTWLNRQSSYGDAAVDASFYALNTPRHRVTLSGIAEITEWLTLRADNEYRRQFENALRAGSDSALFTHLGATLVHPRYAAWELNLRIDNLWKTGFQEVPGTPGRGRQFALDLGYQW